MSEYLFDFYELLVENVFGSIIMAILAIGAIIAVILLMAKTRQAFFIIWIIFYFGTMMALYLGAIGMVILFAASFIGLVWPLIRMFGGER